MVAEGEMRHMKENQLNKGSKKGVWGSIPQLLPMNSKSRVSLCLNNSTAGQVPPASLPSFFS